MLRMHRPKKNTTIGDEQPMLKSEFRGLLHIDYQDALAACYDGTDVLQSYYKPLNAPVTANSINRETPSKMFRSQTGGLIHDKKIMSQS